ncbi:hypothetical protein H696_00217 [Fonticula alba]|uniref:Protein transport protein SEC23 n=1 Tax=Fonticula alba TaxID=691883 RepID=A0A058ZGK8_FONAL|nr:hypothetical protein H696_00217 [Fonticula alba]KCV72632.1 hypothetical protein H696_00217 [Fonticula alba]|eukprot:XP_009492333.1 hypothetical protein H696_00217 [Fonticula alba]
MSSYEEIEARDGVRFSWNLWPNTRVEATRMVVPIGALYTPMRPQPAGINPVYYDPVSCRPPCRGILNPYCHVDFKHKIWQCPFCSNRNQFPPHYKDLSETNMLAELLPQYTTIEYTLSRPVLNHPVFLYVVDTCIEPDELQALRASLVASLSLLPPTAIVGLITFGNMVNVHELENEDCTKTYVFQGTTDYPSAKIQKLLGLSSGRPIQMPGNQTPIPTFSAARFFQPIRQCDMNLTLTFENLMRDPWPVRPQNRPLRSTGAALSIAVGLLESAFPTSGARIMTFLRGACTQGPGIVVSSDLRETIRTHADIDKNNAKKMAKATKFYDDLAKRLTNNGHTADVFIASIEQAGLRELKSMVDLSNGLCVLTDSFKTDVFRHSLIRHLSGTPAAAAAPADPSQPQAAPAPETGLAMGFNATFEVLTSRELKVSGLIGNATSLGVKAANISDTEIGLGGTNAWRISSLSPQTTLGVYFDLVQANQPLDVNRCAFVQFLTTYQHPSGYYRLRVTTVSRHIIEGNPQYLASGFDQAAAAVLMARIAVLKSETDDGPDVLRWLDRMLIRLCQRFANYTRDDPRSFTLSPNFSLYPQVMFHLRRSQFLQVFNYSPDETAYFRHSLLQADTSSSMTMIQPALFSYSIDGTSKPVILDSNSVTQETILLLDTFFEMIILHGATIVFWVKDGYHKRPEYENLRTLLQAPHDDLKALVAGRSPYPKVLICDMGDSQSRFMLAKLNPSTTHVSGASQGVAVLTDDVSFQVFMDHLTKLAVSSSN